MSETPQKEITFDLDYLSGISLDNQQVTYDKVLQIYSDYTNVEVDDLTPETIIDNMPTVASPKSFIEQQMNYSTGLGFKQSRVSHALVKPDSTEHPVFSLTYFAVTPEMSSMLGFANYLKYRTQFNNVAGLNASSGFVHLTFVDFRHPQGSQIISKMSDRRIINTLSDTRKAINTDETLFHTFALVGRRGVGNIFDFVIATVPKLRSNLSIVLPPGSGVDKLDVYSETNRREQDLKEKYVSFRSRSDDS